MVANQVKKYLKIFQTPAAHKESLPAPYISLNWINAVYI